MGSILTGNNEQPWRTELKGFEVQRTIGLDAAESSFPEQTIQLTARINPVKTRSLFGLPVAHEGILGVKPA
jgi:hypothetical protein